MNHFLAIENHTKEEIEELLALAEHYKAQPFSDVFKNKTLIALFFNPSTRTKTTFDLAATQLGGHCVCLEPGKSSWGIEAQEHAVMDGDKEEHLKDAAKVLSSYGDILALRCFPAFKNWKEEKKDSMLANLAKWSTKPVINMETISHPCQALAMIRAIKSKFSTLKHKKFVLTWIYHPQPLNTAVANSAGMIASMLGMDITIANPEGYDLDAGYLKLMGEHCKKNQASFRVVHDMNEAMEGADFVYAKSWGSLGQYGAFNQAVQDSHRGWIVDEKKMALTHHAYFSHCLPIRRNVKATDAVLDSEQCLIYEEAANRLPVQKAIITKLMEGNP